MINFEETEARVEAIVRKLIDSLGLLELAVEVANLSEEEAAYIGRKPEYQFFVYGDEDALLEYQAENEYEGYSDESD